MNANSNLNTRLKCSTPNCEPKNWTHISLKNKESLLIVELDEFGDLKLNYFGHLQLSPSLKIVLSMWSILVCCSYDVTRRMWLKCDVELAPLPAYFFHYLPPSPTSTVFVQETQHPPTPTCLTFGSMWLFFLSYWPMANSFENDPTNIYTITCQRKIII